jgi:hypothetical protein
MSSKSSLNSIVHKFPSSPLTPPFTNLVALSDSLSEIN